MTHCKVHFQAWYGFGCKVGIRHVCKKWYPWPTVDVPPAGTKDMGNIDNLKKEKQKLYGLITCKIDRKEPIYGTVWQTIQ